MPKRKDGEWRPEYMEAIVSMYKYVESPRQIHTMLANLYPNERIPNVREIGLIIHNYFGEKVEATAGNGSEKTYFGFMLSKEVADFLNELPTTRSRGDAVNTILLWYIREYRYKQAQQAKEREQRLQSLTEYSKRFSETHHADFYNEKTDAH